MNINNIALVRATNYIPTDGVVRPISEVPYIVKKHGTVFSGKMTDLLKEWGEVEKLDITKMGDEDYYDEYVKQVSNKTNEYLPYVSDYNSMVLFSLNGLCPDDSEIGFGNNKFSDKICAIIEPLSHHIEDAASLHPTDTAIKGSVELSDSSIILIEKDVYEALSEDEKKNLSSLKMQIKLFSGDLKSAVKQTLNETGMYTAEDLTLSREKQGFLDSPTSEELVKAIDEISDEYKIPKKRFFDLITEVNNDDFVLDDIDNARSIYDYYMTKFLTGFLKGTDAPEDLIDNISGQTENAAVINEVIQYIKFVGKDKYENYVKNYNEMMQQARENESLETPKEILFGSSRNNSK